jgi:hypothetical protein
MDNLQEKFQVLGPCKEEAGESWASFESARRPRPQPRLLMPSAEIKEPTLANMRLTIGGFEDVSDNPTIGDLRTQKGFIYAPMKAIDDQYTGEHADLFYGEAHGQDESGESVTGFVERNNYLDRLAVAWLSLSVIPLLSLSFFGDNLWSLIA